MTGVTSDVGVPSTYVVNPILPLKCNFACNFFMYINSRWDIIYSMFTTDALYEIEHMRIFTFIFFYFQKQFRYLLQIYDSQIHINCMSGTDGTSVYITICMDGIGESTTRWKSHGNVVPSLIARFMGPTWGPIWGRQDPGGPNVGPMNFAIWDGTNFCITGSLWGDFIGDRWIPSQRASDEGLWYLFWCEI